MTPTFFERPILNSPYDVPKLHHALDKDGQPLDEPPAHGRRRSELITPVPKPRKKKNRPEQGKLALGDKEGLSTAEQEYNPTPIINEIRSHVASWRDLPNPADWNVTPATARLLNHWRHYNFETVRPFFCQIEAVETVIWLTEVARGEKRYAKFWEHLRGANEQSNPELLRIAMKMATGSGKTTVMAMLMAWQTVNAVRSPTSSLFSRGFLIVTPGITIRDRLRVLLPDDPDNYYRTRELVPADILGDIAKAKIVITNFHAFKRRETMDLSKVGRALLQGRGDAPETIETEGQMLQRACGELMALKNVVVINDEAHHCYREKVDADDEEDLKGEEKDEAKKNNEAARLWINGIEALKRKVGVRAVYDLSATPFFLRGSGYAEGTLFPWTVSDFSLMDAIECGIVKLPRVPVADNMVGKDMPIYRNLWDHIGAEMPKKGRGKSGELDPLKLPNELQTALHALYGDYAKTYDLWKQVGITVPPVFIVVCNNTSTSQLVYEWISGWERSRDNDDERQLIHKGHLDLFRNYDEYGNRLARPNTLLIDSEQLESGEALDPNFREIAGPEIEQFKREMIQRSGAGEKAAENISDSDLLREVMNTIGREGRLGESVRCVVSVSMLTEGWDANTVTHILGVRAFGTQLLCEQVVGRGLRRQSYDLNEEGLFDVEYADVLGIPFDFTAKPVVAPPKRPKATVRVQALKERTALEITFPRVEGYRVELPDERIVANFSKDSRLILTPEEVGPCKVLLEGIVGEGVELDTAALEAVRPSSISFHLAKHLLYTRFRDPGQEPPLHLFGQIKSIARRWVEEGYLVAKGVPMATVTYLEMAEKAAERKSLLPHSVALLRNSINSPSAGGRMLLWRSWCAIQSDYGTKAAGLMLLPAAWTAPFLALPTALFQEWNSRKTPLSAALRKAGIKLWPDVQKLIGLGFERVIVRSSAADEDLDDRGRYISVVEKKDLTFETLCRTIETIYKHFSHQRNAGQIGIVIQGYVVPDISGHLSNEVHLTPTRNQWEYEIEVPSYAPPRGLNSKFSPIANEKYNLKKKSGETLSTALRRVAQWVNSNVRNRTHLEWCLARDVLWIFQLDIESETSAGSDPQNMPQLRRKVLKHRVDSSDRHVFEQYQVGSPTAWGKLKNVDDFQTGEKPSGHRLFFATAKDVKLTLGRSKGAKILASEIDTITGGRAVVRTDTTSKDVPRFNMARTHTVTGVAAVEWMQKQIALYEKQKINLAEVCFITHGFIPARAAAWTYYVPGAEVVEVDALWGLPDGLQFLPHDSFQCDPISGNILSEKIRYKPQFLQEQENGTWRYEAVARQYGRSRTLSREALKELSLKTVAIAKNIGGAAQVMWFCDIPSEAGIGKHLPWYRAKDTPERAENRRPPFRTISVSSMGDLKSIEHVVDKAKVILRVFPDAKLIRDETFLDAVISTAKQFDLPIELAGSLLGHAYYKIRNAGIVVYTAEPYAAYFRVRGRKTFHKLVRDEIPKKIGMGGEKIIQARLSNDDAVYALLGKLVEEGQELGRAKTDNERTEELADIYEIVLALAARCGKTIHEIESAAEKKRATRGGFSENTILIETHLPIPGKKQDVQADRKQVSLHEVGEVRITDSTAILPLSRLIRPGSSLSFRFVHGEIEIQVTATLSGSGIELKIDTQPRATADQRRFNFGELN